MDETWKHCAEANQPERNKRHPLPLTSAPTPVRVQDRKQTAGYPEQKEGRRVTAYILQDLKRNYEDDGDGDYIII